MGGFLHSPNCLRPLLANVVSSINSATCLPLFPDANELRSRPNWRAFGSKRQSQRRSPNWLPRTAKYTVRYPEAVRSLAEDEAHLFTFYALTRDAAPPYSEHQCH